MTSNGIVMKQSDHIVYKNLCYCNINDLYELFKTIREITQIDKSYILPKDTYVLLQFIDVI